MNKMDDKQIVEAMNGALDVLSRMGVKHDHHRVERLRDAIEALEERDTGTPQAKPDPRDTPHYWKALYELEKSKRGEGEVLPNGYSILPSELTAENGAKYLLSGEFFEEIEILNPDYDEGADLEPEYMTQSVPVKWTTIKEIYKRIAGHYTTTPKVTV